MNTSFGILIDRWVKYLDGDPELMKRILHNGVSCSLEGCDILELKLDKLSTPLRFEVKNGRIFIHERKAVNPFIIIEMPMNSFRKLALTEDRVIWSLLDNETKLTISPKLDWNNFITIMEVFVALQEELDKSSDLS